MNKQCIYIILYYKFIIYYNDDFIRENNYLIEMIFFKQIIL